MKTESGPVSAVAPVPWPTETLWAEAQATLRHSLAMNAARLAPARRLAAAIAHHRACLAALFDAVAEITCAVCTTPCCQHAKVWLDFTDLLFLHLNRVPLPPRQLRGDLNAPCRFLGPQGCRLPHQTRPWICDWYICPDLQRAIARDIPGGWVQVERIRARVKSRRDAMEAAYLKVVAYGVTIPLKVGKGVGREQQK